MFTLEKKQTSLDPIAFRLIQPRTFTTDMSCSHIPIEMRLENRQTFGASQRWNVENSAIFFTLKGNESASTNRMVHRFPLLYHTFCSRNDSKRWDSVVPSLPVSVTHFSARFMRQRQKNECNRIHKDMLRNVDWVSEIHSLHCNKYWFRFFIVLGACCVVPKYRVQC